jgi:hypothetical protein
MRPNCIRWILTVLVGIGLTAMASWTRAGEPLVFISAFAAGDDGAIHACRLHLKTGTLEPVHRTTGVELCANMPGNNVVVFRIDPQTGKLASVGPPVSMPSPACIRLMK